MQRTGYKRTLLAGLIFLLGLGVFYWDEKYAANLLSRRMTALRLIPYPKDEIAGIVISRLGATLEFHKQGGDWKIIKPIETDADADALQLLIDRLDTQQKYGSDSANERDLSKYGLGKPSLNVTVKSENKKTSAKEVTLMIGDDAPVTGEVFARFKDGREYFTVSSDLRNLLVRSMYDYRDKRLLSLNAMQADSITLHSPAATVELSRKTGQWFIDRPTSYTADTERVEDILREFQTTRAIDFLDTATLQTEGLGLEAPAVAAIVSVTSGDQPKRSTLLVGRPRPGEPPAYYACRAEGKTIFTVPDKLYKDLQPTVSDLRSRQIFTLNHDQIWRLSLEFTGHKVDLQKDTGGRWVLLDDPTARVDQKFMKTVLDRLLKVKIAEFLNVEPLPEQSGLDAPYMKLEVSDVSGQKKEGFATARTVQDHNLVYARRLSDKEVFTVPLDQPGKFFLLHDMFLDHTLFTFTPDSVGSVLITSKNKTMRFTKAQDSWTVGVDGGKETFQANANPIMRLILATLTIEWKKPLNVGDPNDFKLISEHKLDPPEQTLKFLDSSGKELGRLDIGTQNSAEESQLFLRRDQKDFFAADKSFFESFAAALKDLMTAQ